MKERVKYSDALKFVSIIMVIAIHIFCDYRDLFIGNNQLKYAILTFFDSLTRVAVPMFFMITGSFMLSNKKNEKYLEHLKKRIPNLFIPFFLISIIYYMVNQYNLKENLSIIDFVGLFTTGNIKYHFWFMYTIIMIYMFIPFIKKLVQNISKKELITLIILIFIFGNVMSFLSIIFNKYNIKLLSSFVLPDIIIYINYLLVGYYLYNNKINEKNKKIIYIVAIISIILMNIVDNLYNTEIRIDVILTANSIFALIPSIAVYTLFKDNYDKLNIPKFFDKFITKNSKYIFYIYMLHVLVKEEIVIELINLFYNPVSFIGICVVIILRIILTFIISYIFSIIVEYLYSSISKLIINTSKKLFN